MVKKKIVTVGLAILVLQFLLAGTLILQRDLFSIKVVTRVFAAFYSFVLLRPFRDYRQNVI